MRLKKIYENKLLTRLDELRTEIDGLRKKVEQAEVNLQLEYYTLIDELQVKLEFANLKLQRKIRSGEEDWEEIETEFELIWNSLRELIKSVTSP